MTSESCSPQRAALVRHCRLDLLPVLSEVLRALPITGSGTHVSISIMCGHRARSWRNARSGRVWPKAFEPKTTVLMLFLA